MYGVETYRTGLANLWHAKWFPWNAACTAVQIFSFFFDRPASLYCEEYPHIWLLRGCIWITVATEQQCEWNILIQIGSGAKCWMDICHWDADLVVSGRIRAIGQNVLQYFEIGSSNTLSYFQIVFLIAFIEEAFIRNMIFMPCIIYTVTIVICINSNAVINNSYGRLQDLNFALQNSHGHAKRFLWNL
jgi:hypothetical protein